MLRTPISFAAILSVRKSELRGVDRRTRNVLLRTGLPCLFEQLPELSERACGQVGPGRVYCIVGDGEQQEGQIWEAAMYAGSQELDNLVVLVDDNGMQIDDYTDAINAVRPLDKRWEAFGWATLCIDGHNFSDLEAALTHARTIKKRPTAIIMATVKGKGLSVAEGKLSSHNMPLSPEDVAAALQELQ